MPEKADPIKRKTIPVYVVVPPYTLLMDVAGPVEVLRRANVEQTDIQFDFRFISSQPQQISSIGLQVAGLESLPDLVPENAYIIVSGTITPPFGAVDPASEYTVIARWLKKTVKPGMHLVTICSGALLAAQAGLLDGYACTTHALSVDELRALAPNARVLDNRLYVEDGERLSSAGISTGTDLMLHIISTLTTPIVALAVARYMVIYMRRTGAEPQFSPWLSGRNHIHPAIHRIQDAIIADPSCNWSLAELAELGIMSTRNLTRLFHEHTGLSVTSYVNLMRVTLAKDILSNSSLDMERVAEKTGFASPRHLRRVWSKYNAVPPREFRNQMSSSEDNDALLMKKQNEHIE